MRRYLFRRDLVSHRLLDRLRYGYGCITDALGAGIRDIRCTFRSAYICGAVRPVDECQAMQYLCGKGGTCDALLSRNGLLVECMYGNSTDEVRRLCGERDLLLNDGRRRSGSYHACILHNAAYHSYLTSCTWSRLYAIWHFE